MGLDRACSPLACTESAEHSHPHVPKQGTPHCARSHRGRQPSCLFGITRAAAAGAEPSRRSTTHDDALPLPRAGRGGNPIPNPALEAGQERVNGILPRTGARSPSLPWEIPRAGAAAGSPPRTPEHFQSRRGLGMVVTDIILVSFQFRPVITW